MEKEKRLIDANILESWIDANILESWIDVGIQGAEEGNGNAPIVSLYDVLIELDNIPTVDAVEVVHGRWEDVLETEMYVPDMKFTITKTAETCSECKARIGFIGAKRYLFDAICPNCGAKMDGDGNG